jgi:LysR family transcriptional regulator, hydrogen peroxide-inducible genes activator
MAGGDLDAVMLALPVADAEIETIRLFDDPFLLAVPAGDPLPKTLGATSLATVMQMVASGYGVTLVPEVAVDVEIRDQRVKLLRFTAPEPGRTIGLAWRRTSPRKVDFVALGQIAIEALRATGRRKTNKPAMAATPAD